MSLLSGTPYLLEPEERARAVVASAQQLEERVRLLRRNGKLDAATLGRLRNEWGVRQVYESAGIEGNTLDLSETQVVIRQGITISGKPADHSNEVINLNRALEYVEELAADSTPISEREICELQSLIVGTQEHDAGRYRSIEVALSGSSHRPPHPLKVPDMMRELADWLAAAQPLPVVLRVAVFHAWFTHVHPFRDGNGRTARAVSNLMLVRSGFPIVIVRRKDRQRYYEALRNSDSGDISPLLELMAERCSDMLKQIDRVRKEVTGISLALEKIREREELHHRVWLDGIRLFGSTLEERLRQAEMEDSAIQVSIARYDLPTFEDFRALCDGDPSGNTWFMKFTVTRRSESHSVLLWIGFSSDELNRSLAAKSHLPALKLSMRNTLAAPPWIVPDQKFPTRAREFAYRDGEYLRIDAGGKMVRYSTASAAATKLTEELLVGWFAGESA